MASTTQIIATAQSSNSHPHCAIIRGKQQREACTTFIPWPSIVQRSNSNAWFALIPEDS